MPYASLPGATLPGATLHYRDTGGAGAPVLLIHELGGSGASWDGLTPLLAPRRAIAPDLRHAGLSEKPPGNVELADLADDLASLLALLGIGAADVIGSALGSLVALVLARRHPGAVRRMVLCTAASEVSAEARLYIAGRAERVRREGMRPLAETSLANSFPDPHGAARASYLPAFLGNAPDSYAELSLALCRLDLTPADFARIATPTLVLQGAADFIWPPATGARVAELLPHARFRVLDDAAHFPHVQVPRTMAPIALDFLD